MQDAGFRITIEVGHTKMDFLDVSLELANDTYRPYRKANSKLSYIHKSSNHPLHIKSTLPQMIEKRIRTLSKSQQVFDEAKLCYNQALEESGYKHKLAYEPPTLQIATKKRSRNRRRKCIFYNPPYCQSAKTNIGKSFLALIDKHFGKDHDYHSIFNRSTVKISYSCMPNAKNLIQSHNKRILRASEEKGNSNKSLCNCTKYKCPLNGECLTENVVYEAKVTTSKPAEYYIGSTGGTFKSRHEQHKAAFKHRGTKETALSQHIWKLKDEGVKYEISWRIIRRIGGGKKASAGKICSTCNMEKLEIALADKRNLLNKRSELSSQCPHFKKNYFNRLK